jgi:ubiquitin-protein ligase
MNNNVGINMSYNMNNMNNNMNNINNIQDPVVLTRLKKEFQLCLEDNDLIQIGCNFGLDNNNIFTWKVTMTGPVNTPYEGGLFKLSIIFPKDYPSHGPEFRFRNRMYHLNVINDESNKEFGHICVNSINEWKGTGKVKGSFYTVKQALFDIFCLFYNQGVDSAFDEKMAADYKNNPEAFNQEAKKWTEMYAPQI